MQIRDILVSLEIDLFSPTLVHCAVDLARRFDAGLIGHAAASMPVVSMGYEGGAALATLYEREQEDIRSRLVVLEQQFREAVPESIPARWLGTVDDPTTSAVRACRNADLILTGSNVGALNRNPQRSIDTGDLLVRAGRPVLIAGVGLAQIEANNVVVGWKDSREARRAIVDALPFLQLAKKVIVATIHEGDLAEEKASLDDVATWLRRHQVEAERDVRPETGGGAAETLEALAKEQGADLIVTGGYGHSRMREWLFGGMTRDLLSDRTVHRFLSN